MKQGYVSFFLKTLMILLGILAFCGLGVYANGDITASLLVTPGCLLIAFGLYRADEQLSSARHKRYKVCRRHIRMAPQSSGPMRAA